MLQDEHEAWSVTRTGLGSAFASTALMSANTDSDEVKVAAISMADGRSAPCVGCV